MVTLDGSNVLIITSFHCMTICLAGIDSTATYTSKMSSLEAFKGSATLRQFTDEPRGVNALLAQESGGAIFDSSMLSDKGFNDVFVKRLVMKSEPAECQVCSCVHDDLVGVGRSVCEKCSNPLNVFGEVCINKDSRFS